MKQYIKPQTEVQDVVINSAFMQASTITTVDVNNTTENNVVGAAKERDVWTDGFWN